MPAETLAFTNGAERIFATAQFPSNRPTLHSNASFFGHNPFSLGSISVFTASASSMHGFSRAGAFAARLTCRVRKAFR